MKREASEQFSLAEAFIGRKLGANETLERIGTLVRWYRFEKLMSRLHAAQTGRPSYPPLMMFRALLLAQWYGLSDEGLEEALNDRLSFRRFAGLGLDGATPDHSTLCRFRNDLAAAGLTEKLFAEMNRQLERLGLVLKRGTLIDATLVEAATRPPAFGSEEEGADPDAAFARRAGRGGSTYGFKAHVAVDQETILIRDAILTPGNVNDTVVADELIQGDEGAVYADAAYDTHARRAMLKARGNCRSHHASSQQAPSRAGALAEAPQSRDLRHPLPGRDGLRHPETPLRLRPGPLPRPDQEPEPSPSALPCPQSAAGRRPDALTPGVRP